MKCNRGVCTGVLLFSGLLIPSLPATEQAAEHPATTADQQKHDNDKPVDSAGLSNPVLWHDPGRLRSSISTTGKGGKMDSLLRHTNLNRKTRLDQTRSLTCAMGRESKWRVKLGDEARPEVVASRLLWAMGYFVDDDYLVASADVDGLEIRRGAKTAKDEHITDARFERKPEGEKKLESGDGRKIRLPEKGSSTACVC